MERGGSGARCPVACWACCGEAREFYVRNAAAEGLSDCQSVAGLLAAKAQAQPTLCRASANALMMGSGFHPQAPTPSRPCCRPSCSPSGEHLCGQRLSSTLSLLEVPLRDIVALPQPRSYHPSSVCFPTQHSCCRPAIFDIAAASVYIALSLQPWIAVIVFVTLRCEGVAAGLQLLPLGSFGVALDCGDRVRHAQVSAGTEHGVAVVLHTCPV